MRFRDRLAAYWRRLIFGPVVSPAPTAAVTEARAETVTGSEAGPTANSGAYAGLRPTAEPTTGWLAPPSLMAGRQTLPTNANFFGLSGFAIIWKREYQQLDLAEIDLSQYEAGQLLAILADLSPDVSRAVWNVLRIAGHGLTFHATTASGVDDPVGQTAAEALAGRLNPKAGGMNALIVQLLLTAYLQGAVCVDVAPAEHLGDCQDIYTVNPVTIWFVRDLNQNPVPFQRQPILYAGATPYRRMNEELFFYTPIDPYVDDVYGRPPAAAVLQVVFFQVQVLRDLERVLHAQGWPKIDIALVLERLIPQMPVDVKKDPNRQAVWIAARMAEVASAYNGMDPEDAYIHLDYVEVGSDAAKAGTNLPNIESLMGVIRGQIISALKQLPVLMGEHLGETETYSTVELEIFTRSIEAFREPVGAILARALEMGLQLQGIQTVLRPVWPALAVSDPLQAAVTDAQRAANEAYKRDQGWITQTQASEAITGSAEVAPAPGPGTVNAVPTPLLVKAPRRTDDDADEDVA